MERRADRPLIGRWIIMAMILFVPLGCGEVGQNTTVIGPDPAGDVKVNAPDAPSSLQTSSSDSTYWVGNEMEFEADGHEWLLVRDDSTAQNVTVYQDGVAVYDMTRDINQGTVEAVRFDNASGDEWLEADASGVITATSYGCTPNHMDPDCPEPEFTLLDDCETLGFAAVGLAVGAGVAGAAAWWAAPATGGASVPVATHLTSAAVSSTVGLVGATTAWIACKFASGGDEECDPDEDPECEPDVEFTG